MTLGNMRANGVRTLATWCLGRGCDHPHGEPTCRRGRYWVNSRQVHLVALTG